MASPRIRSKRSSVEGKVPAASQLMRGEFAVNSFDGKVYILKDQTSVGIATTTVTVNPWDEPNGVGAGVSYSSDVNILGVVTATSFVGDGSGLTNINVAGISTFSGNYNHLYNKPTIPTNNNQLTNGAGYITGYTVTQSDVTGHQAALSITESQISDLGTYASASSLATVATSGSYNDLSNTPTIPTNNNQLTNGAGYITGYTVTESDVTTHQAALSITESQISDFGTYATAASVAGIDTSGFIGAGSTFSGNYNHLYNKPTIPTNNNQLTNGAGYITGYTVTQSDVTAHQSALSITESQISDLGTYLTSSDLSSYATTSYVDTEVAGLVDSAPGTLNTLNELAAALGDDANFSTTVTNSIAGKLPLSGGTMTGNITFSSGQTFDYNNLTNKPTIPTNNNQLTNGAGYITSADGGNAATLDGVQASEIYRTVGTASATVGPGWITVATNTSGRKHGEIIVSDSDSGDHGFIRIDWMRSYADSNFTVLNCGGHQNRITGARVLYQNSNNTYGEKILQVYVTTTSTYRVQVNQLQNQTGWAAHTVHTPVVESPSGYSVHGNSLESLQTYGLAHEEGIQAGGSILAGGDITSSSDISLKENVVTYENALDKVLAMRGVEYDRKDQNGKHEVGLIAQEVENIIPEVVAQNNGIKSIAYGKLTAVLIEAIKEQQEQIKHLQQQLNIGK